MTKKKCSCGVCKSSDKEPTTCGGEIPTPYLLINQDNGDVDNVINGLSFFIKHYKTITGDPAKETIKHMKRLEKKIWRVINNTDKMRKNGDFDAY